MLLAFISLVFIVTAFLFFGIALGHKDEMDSYAKDVCGMRGKEIVQFRRPLWDLQTFTLTKVKILASTITAGLYAVVAIYLAGVSIAEFINTGTSTTLLSPQINLIVFSVVVAVGAFYFSSEFWFSNITEAFRIEVDKRHATRADLLVKFNAKYAKAFKQHLAVLILALVVLANVLL